MARTRAEIDAEKAHKSRPDLIAGSALHEEGLVQGMGFRKHGPCTWRVAGTEQAKPETHVASAMRHMIELLRHGPAARDPESGLLHAAHARAQLGIAIDCIYLHAPHLLDVPEMPIASTSVGSAFAAGAVEGEAPSLPEGWAWARSVHGPRRGWAARRPFGWENTYVPGCFIIDDFDRDSELREWAARSLIPLDELTRVRACVRDRNGWSP